MTEGLKLGVSNGVSLSEMVRLFDGVPDGTSLGEGLQLFDGVVDSIILGDRSGAWL